MSLRAAVATLVAPAALFAVAPAFGAEPQSLGSIDLPGRDPVSLAVYETGNKVFVGDDDMGQLVILDGATHQVLQTPTVGGSPLAIAVNETHGKVYVASRAGCCTSGLNEGTGLIEVVNASNGTLGTAIDPNSGGANSSQFALASDEVHDKVYVGHSGGFGVIDVAANPSQFNGIAGAPAPTVFTDTIAINTVTNEVFYIDHLGQNRLVIVDADADPPAVSFFDFDPTGGSKALDVAVSEPENKVYVTMVLVPGQGEPGILVLDRDTGQHKFVGKSDLNPVAFNQSSNRLFAGIQVGTVAGIVEGATDGFTPINFPTGGVGSLDVRASSDNAYMASPQATYVVNGATKCVRRFASVAPQGGGVVVSSAAVNEVTGRAYVVNHQGARKVAVFQDGEVSCAPPATLLTADHLDRRATATWSLAPEHESDVIEVAVSPATEADGGFFESNMVDRELFLAPDQTSWTGHLALDAGTYYLHVSACSVAAFVCTPAEKQWSDVGSFTVPPEAVTGGGGAAPPGDGAAPGNELGDLDPPAMTLSMLRSQRLTSRGLTLSVGCGAEACTVAARGSVSVPAAARLVRFRSVRVRVPAGAKRRIALRLARRDMVAVRRALRRGRRLTARVTVAATDAAGNTSRTSRRIRLRR